MPLTPESALRKDRTTAPTMEHRHFATVAQIIREMPDPGVREHTAEHFSRALARTNPRFDRRRFLAACQP